MVNIIRRFSPAKLNLGLRIMGLRPDGYHSLDSTFVPIDFGDELEIRKSPSMNLVVEWAADAPRKDSLPKKEENLLWKILMAVSTKTTDAWEVKLTKRIPLGSGLGGGSSNAGTLLCYFLSLGFNESFIRKLAVGLGADVPFFLSPVPSKVQGKGEIITPLGNHVSYPSFFFLVFPPQGSSTKRVFELFDQSPTTARSGNDLEEAAIQLLPELGEILSALRGTAPAYCSISGSGSTCFAAYHSREQLTHSSKVLTAICRERDWKNLTATTYSE